MAAVGVATTEGEPPTAPTSATTADVLYVISEPPPTRDDATDTVTVLKLWFVGSSGRPQVTEGVSVIL
jgi:hypothetical protein